MPRFNFTFQEASPLITYNGVWLEGTKDDQFFQSYNGSFRVTNTSGAQATLIFNGTGVSLFGAMRPNHGDYGVTLDHGATTRASGNSPQNLFQLPLSEMYNLSDQQHTVEVVNDPTSSNTPYFDLDFVQIERVVGRDNDTLFQSTVDDTSSLISYVGPWVPSSAMAASNNNGTNHQTLQGNSSFKIAFRGCCIELYGLYANAAYTVAVDGGLPVQMQGQDLDLTPDAWHPQTLLYVVDGLSENTNHTVSLITTFATEQRPFFFDYGVVRSTQSLSGALPLLPTSANNSSKKSMLPAIIGASIGGAVLFGLTVIALIIWCRRRRGIAALQQDMTAERIPDQPRPSLFPWPRNDRALRPVSITAWYPPNETQPELHNLMDASGAGTNTFSSANIDALPPNANVNRRFTAGKRRRDVTPQATSLTDAITSSVSTVQVQSTSSLVASTATRSRRPPHGSDNGSTVISSSSASRDQQTTTGASIPIQEEDAGRLDSEDQEGTLPPAYNPGWNPPD